MIDDGKEAVVGADRVGEAWPAPDLHDLADLLASLVPSGHPSDLLDQLEALERIKAAAAAAQVAVTTAFADVADAEHVPTSGRRTPPRDVDRRRGRARDARQPVGRGAAGPALAASA